MGSPTESKKRKQLKTHMENDLILQYNRNPVQDEWRTIKKNIKCLVVRQKKKNYYPKHVVKMQRTKDNYIEQKKNT